MSCVWVLHIAYSYDGGMDYETLLTLCVSLMQDFGRHTSKRTFIQHYIDAVSFLPNNLEAVQQFIHRFQLNINYYWNFAVQFLSSFLSRLRVKRRRLYCYCEWSIPSFFLFFFFFSFFCSESINTRLICVGVGWHRGHDVHSIACPVVSLRCIHRRNALIRYLV